MEPTIEKCIRMMEYLGKHTFVIPHHNLPLPPEADGDRYRSEKLFELMRMSGLMHYRGWGKSSNGSSMDISTFGIAPPKQFVERAYIYLIDEVRIKVARQIKNAKMKGVGELILRFNHIDFVDLFTDEISE